MTSMLDSADEYVAGDPDLRPRNDRPPIPDRMRHLLRDRRGFVVPWFVPWIDHEPEFRALDGQKFEAAIKRDLCWLCGGTLGRHKIFVSGAMCVINRISPEPPCHLACADFAVRVCPFLTHPKMRRNETKLDYLRQHGRNHPAANPRNPGVVALYDTNGYRVLRDFGHVLLQMGPAMRIGWYTRGRTATRGEVMSALEAGKLVLSQQCFAEGGDQDIIERQYRTALTLLPQE